MEITFREFEKAEEQKIVAMMWALNHEDQEEMPLSEIKVKELFDYVQRENNVKVFVAQKEGELIGYAIFVRSFSVEYSGLFGELDELYLLPDLRGQGIGTAFIGWIEDYARSVGCNFIDMVANFNNTKAQELYRRLGYQPLPRTTYVKEL